MGPTHGLVGFSTATVAGTAAGLGFRELAVMVAAASWCSRTPDRREYVGVRVPWHRRRWLWRRRVFRHRGPTHWPETWLGLSMVAVLLAVVFGAGWWAALPWAAGFSIGYGMHLVADAMTRDGLEVWSLGHEYVWGEWRRRDVHLLPERFRPYTGGRAEAWLARLGLVAVAGFVWVSYSPMLIAGV